MHGQTQYVKMIYVVNNGGGAPHALFEYAYYAVIAFQLLGNAWGLVVPLLGAGMLAVLAGACLIYSGSRAITADAPILFPLACVISFVALQIIVHNESLMGSDCRAFVTWLLALIVVQSLSLRRGFLHRFAVAALLIGLATIPYLTFWGGDDEVTRLAVGGETGLTNPTVLGEWFGFCSVYFILMGIEARRNIALLASWLVAIGCLYITTMTVSRTPLSGVAIAMAFALRRLLKRGFVPILCLLVLSWLIFASGLFDRIGSFYAERGTEDTGRMFLWPLAIERFLSSPLVGVGLSNIDIPLPPSNKLVGPHNGFLYIALASGVVPLAFFLVWWIRAAWGAFRANAERLPDAPLLIPLFIFAFLEMMASATSFMSVWHSVVLSIALSALTPQRVWWVKNVWKPEHLGCRGEARYVRRYQLPGHPWRSRRTSSK
jgi:O-antigen ligase